MTLEGPHPPTFESAWGNVLAELEGKAPAGGSVDLDRFISVDFVSDLLSSEGFEAFSTPGHDEQKLTRLASLELLSELFGVEGGLAEGQRTPSDQGSGVSNGTIGEGSLAGNVQVQQTGSSSWQMDSNWDEWRCEAGKEAGMTMPPFGESPDELLPKQAATLNTSKGQETKAASVLQVIPARASTSTLKSSQVPAIPPFRGTGQVPSQTTPTPCLVTSELSDPLANPRTRFTAKQQNALYDFGVSINWVTSALEAEPRAHKLCAKLGIGLRQLKKWVSNHRPRENKLPVSHPPWILPAGLKSRNASSHPPLSQAALASLAAAEAAVMGQPFPSPFDASNPVQGPYAPFHNAWPHPAPPGPVGAFPPPFSTPQGMFADGGMGAPHFAQGGVQPQEWGSGSSGESHGAQNEGVPESVQQAGVNKGAASDDVKKVLRRKLKDFEPEKVRRLFDLCVEYRKKRSSLRTGGSSAVPSEPPSKRQRTFVSDPPLTTGLVMPPLTPPNLPVQTGLTHSSESGENSALTHREEPRTCLPNLQPVSSGGWQTHREQTPLESGGSFPSAWNSGGLAGQPFSTLPSFPSIDLTHWSSDEFLGGTPETQAPETPQLAPESSGFGYQDANPGFECPVEGVPLHPPTFGSGPGNFWPGTESRGSLLQAARSPSRSSQRGSSCLTSRVSTGLTGRSSAGLTGRASIGLTGRGSPGLSGRSSFGLTGQVSIGLTGRNSTSLNGRGFTSLTGRPSTGLTKRSSSGLIRRSSAGLKERKVPVQIPGCTFLFEKTLTMSDTTPLGRIILPKVHAEAHLPKAGGKEGSPLPVTDADGRTWELRYSAWLNNKSRMYVLEHVGDLLQARRLAPGDSIAFYRANDGRLIMTDQKHRKPPSYPPRASESAAMSGFGVDGAFN